MMMTHYIHVHFEVRRDIHECPSCRELTDSIHDFRLHKMKGGGFLTKYAVKNRKNSLKSGGVTLRKAKSFFGQDSLI